MDIVNQLQDDIVIRLRVLSASQKAHRFGELLDDWSGEAADEIERLRKELAEALETNKQLHKELDAETWGWGL